ncbi:hypothetical protein BJY52DRAFT_1418216 [Lactarius psammicola]|nr:hypothetical protein BJY52DRAFT_1418216 [Lactarius psammicola]
MDSSRANPQEYLRQAIDAEIRSLEGSIRALRLRRNALAPILSLPTEVIATIFSFLHVRVTLLAFKLGEKPDGLAWLSVAHVCHQWREIALNQPLFWSHIDFTAVSSAGAAEILARANMAPLHLKARVPHGLWDDARFSAFQNELHPHVSHTCHLGISAEPFHLRKILEGLVSPAPILECLSLSGEEYRNRTIGERAFVPDTLFDGSAPRLSCLELWACNISWKSPLLRGLKHLEIRSPRQTPSLSDWLDALDEMPQLKTLTLHWASLSIPPGASLPSDIERTITLPSLTLFEMSSPARDCGLALAHLILPALTSLCLIAKSCHRDCSDVQEILPYVSRHAHGPQDTQPLQSMLVRSGITSAEIIAWTLPDMDVELPSEIAFFDTMHSGRVAFSFMFDDAWSLGTDVGTFNAVLEALPLGGLVTLTAQNLTKPFDEQFWLRCAPKWPLLRRVHLTLSTERGFREMLLKDNGGHESPLLPSLTKLVLVDAALLECKTVRLRNALLKRMERGVPLETLDLRKCLATSRAVELLSEIAVNVLGPEDTPETEAQVLSESVARGLNLEDLSDESSGQVLK